MCHINRFHQVLSVQSCTDNSSWHQDWGWRLSADLQGILLRVCRKMLHFLLCTHPQESHPASLEGLGRVLRLQEFLARRCNIFYLQQVKLGSFLISNFLLQILLLQWFLPCNFRILKAGAKAFLLSSLSEPEFTAPFIELF